MGDLNEERLRKIASNWVRATDSEVREMASRLVGFMTVQAADKERVRSVARTACLEILMFDESVEAGQIEQIATRVAEQLAMPPPPTAQLRDTAMRAVYHSRSMHAALTRILALVNPAVEQNCPVHTGTIHGGEADELRKGIEEIVNVDPRDMRNTRTMLIRLFDRINARDSLGYLERSDILSSLASKISGPDFTAEERALVDGLCDTSPVGLTRFDGPILQWLRAVVVAWDDHRTPTQDRAIALIDQIYTALIATDPSPLDGIDQGQPEPPVEVDLSEGGGR